MTSTGKFVEGSFRDPSGFLFTENGILYRQVNRKYRDDYEKLTGSGLYGRLVEAGLLIPHEETDQSGITPEAWKVIRPERVPFISYPYEWSFSQLKDTALLTLDIQQAALDAGMTLKDASAYNVQFHRGKPVFIDTLSFETYREGKPWEAYRQFCQHFLAPLFLMSRTDIRMNQLLKIYIDGVPLDLAARLLPASTKWNFSALMHIHLHARSQKKYEHEGVAGKTVQIPLRNLKALIISLRSAVSGLKLPKQGTEWGEYYTFTNYSDDSFKHKAEIIGRFTEAARPATLWDLGANTGLFTRIAAGKGVNCVAFDIDPLAVEANYRQVKQEGTKNLLPLVTDLTNPSPALGWNNEERPGFSGRTLPDAVMALALIHHLAISNNLPFRKIASFFAGLCPTLIIEFVPKSDSQVKKLLESRTDIFGEYNEEAFVREFGNFFEIADREQVAGSERTVYRMTRKA